jgi:hypothetical protein
VKSHWAHMPSRKIFIDFFEENPARCKWPRLNAFSATA